MESNNLEDNLIGIEDPDYLEYENIEDLSRKNAFKPDISDRDSLKFTLDKLEADTNILTAALTDVDKCEMYPETVSKVNTEPFKYIISYLRRHRGRLIQISTNYVFSGKRVITGKAIRGSI